MRPDCCGGTLDSGACWHDVKNVCKVPADYLPMTKPANKFPVFDGTDTYVPHPSPTYYSHRMITGAIP